MISEREKEREARVGEYVTNDNNGNCYLVGDMYRIFK